MESQVRQLGEDLLNEKRGRSEDSHKREEELNAVAHRYRKELKQAEDR